MVTENQRETKRRRTATRSFWGNIMSDHNRVYCLSLLTSLLALFAATPASADIVRQYTSRPGPNEVDTADRGGQVGGIKLGRGYQLIDLALRARRSDCRLAHTPWQCPGLCADRLLAASL